MKIRVFAFGLLLLLFFAACTRETLERTIEGQFVFGNHINYPCIDNYMENYFLKYTLNDNPVCLNDAFLLAHPNCMFERQIAYREVLSCPPFMGDVGPMPILQISLLRQATNTLINTEETLIGHNLLAASSRTWRIKAGMWFSNRKRCAESPSSSLFLDRVQVFSESSLLASPYGASAYFIVTELESIPEHPGAYIMSFIFQLEVFDDHHQQLRIRNGKGRVPVYL